LPRKLPLGCTQFKARHNFTDKDRRLSSALAAISRLINATSSRVACRPLYLISSSMMPSVAWASVERRAYFLGGNFFPHRRGSSTFRVAVPDHKLQLVHQNTHHRGFAFIRPPAKAALGQSLLTQPKALTIIDQNLDGCLFLVHEDKHISAKRIGSEHIFAYRS